MARFSRALGAAVVLLVLLIGVPVVLAATIGNPLDGWSDLKAGDISDTAVIDILAAVAWIAWAQFALATVVEALTRLSRVRTPRRIPGVFAGQQHLARALIAAVFILTPTVAGIVAPVASFATPAPVVASASVHVAPAPKPAAAEHQATRLVEQRAPASTHEYVVPASGGPGTYWALAEHYLGSGDHWKQIWALNEGRTQPDGTVMTNPGLLRPGWTVVLPGDAPTHVEHVTEHITVRAGDTLSGIAEKAGQSDWQQAWQASADHAEPGGRSFTDPDLILPGWTVDVPVTKVVQDVAAAAPVAERPAPAPVAPAPATSPGAASHAAVSDAAPTAVARSENSIQQVLEGGGALLAAGLLTALALGRRRRFRHRRPGRAIAAAPLALADVERAILNAGPAGQADVAFLDQALRHLAEHVGEAGLPELAAVRLVSDQLDLRLSHPHPVAPPAPWTCDDTGFWWSVQVGDELPAAADGLAPYPTLVTIGTGPDGDRWLLDLERAGAVSLVGGPDISADLARFAVAELALNGWSDHLDVTLVGFGAELVDLNPQRLRYSADLTGVVDQLTAAMTEAADVRQSSGAGVLATRLAGDRLSTPHVIFVEPTADPEALQRLLFTVRTQPDRSAVSVVLLADQQHTHQTRYQIELADSGSLELAALGVQVMAQRLSAEHARAFAELIASASDTADRATPAASVREDRSDDGANSQSAGAAWSGLVDEAGLLRPEFRVGAPQPVAPSDAAGIRLSSVGPVGDPGSSLLPEDDALYLDRGATTPEDIALLAPVVSQQLGLRAEDSALDADLDEWQADEPVRPRLAVLGPVRVQTSGNAGAVAGRVEFYSELVASLALDGSVDLVGGAGDRARAMAMLSSWLGTNPVTGQAYLRQDEPATTAVLSDVDLFRRLRLRGQARGAKGLDDLVRALELVRGAPFDQRRPGGYGWLADSRLDDLYAGMVVDVAHLVATRALAEQDPGLARWAAEIGVSAGTDDDVALLDLVAVCSAEGLDAEREEHVRAILHRRGVEAEEDLPARTAEILRRRGWAAAS